MTPRISFRVSFPNPNDHLIHVSMIIDDLPEVASVDIKMPVWSPGSYLIREYPRHVQALHAVDQDGERVATHQLDKSSWRVHNTGRSRVEVRYQLFAHELAVRTNHLDDSHASINGVAAFFYIEEALSAPVDVIFDAPEGWRVFGGMRLVDADTNHYRVDDFDMLYDTPVELGPMTPLEFDVRGIKHEVVVWGEGNFDPEIMLRDMKASVEAHAQMFGGLPYEHYTFIVHLSENGRGGLEHHNSTILLYPKNGFRDGPPGTQVDADGQPCDPYLEFLRLVSHEHFHVWNVKRIRPSVLGPFDYQNENYTRDLWTVEGVTSYYENIGLLRADLLTPERFIGLLADSIKVLESIPGRRLHSLEDASLNAWVKLYRPDENTRNSSISYYLKGELVCFMLDAKIRSETQNKKSLDDVLCALWSHYQETGEGYAEGSYGDWIQKTTGVDVSELLEAYVTSTRDLDWDTALVDVGLKLERTHKKETPGAWLGAKTDARDGRLKITQTPTGSPAHQAGLYAGDELVALDGWRVSTSNLDSLLARYAPGSTISAHLFRRGQLIEREVTLAAPPEDQYTISIRDDASDSQRGLLQEWLGLVIKVD